MQSKATPAELGNTDAKYLMIFCVLHSGLRNRGGSMRVQVSPQVLGAYIRIGIGAALRMQSALAGGGSSLTSFGQGQA